MLIKAHVFIIMIKIMFMTIVDFMADQVGNLYYNYPYDIIPRITLDSLCMFWSFRDGVNNDGTI